MNRAARRNPRPSKQKQPTDNLNRLIVREQIKSEIDKEMTQYYAKLASEAVNSSLSIAIKVLHDRYGFGQKRLTEFVNIFTEQFDAIGKEYATFEDFADLAKLLGVELKGDVL